MSKDAYSTPSIGKRIRVNGYVGTIKYIGEVEGTTGTWLGVEWDDPARGKHDGIKDGKRYFVCGTPGSGSFIRSSPSISYGRSFLQALVSKYVDMPHGSGVSGLKEMVILGSSNGVIEVEAVGFDKVRSKLSNLVRLRQISLVSEDVAWADPPGRIKETCPNVKSLDLSDSLLHSWDMVALITAELLHLRELCLNACRLTMFSDLQNARVSFRNLEELRINQTLISWSEVVVLSRIMPRLKHLECGRNRLDVLGSDSPRIPGSEAMLQTLNLDENKLQDWTDIMTSTSQFSTLTWLILTSNALNTIQGPIRNPIAPDIKHLGLQDNNLRTWRDIDALGVWLPGLQTLSLNGNPIAETSRDFRQQVIARLPALECLDGSKISSRERTDCELYYLAEIARKQFASDSERARLHPRWEDLCMKHGRPYEEGSTKGLKTPNTLAGRLININVYYCDPDIPVEEALSSTLHKIQSGQLPPSKMKVLPSMMIRTLRRKLSKGSKSQPSIIRHDRTPHIWLFMGSDLEVTELSVDCDNKELSWFGIQEESQLIVQI